MRLSPLHGAPIALMGSRGPRHQCVCDRESCLGVVGASVSTQSRGQAGTSIEEIAADHDRDRFEPSRIAAMVDASCVKCAGIVAESAIRSGGRRACLISVTSSRGGKLAPRKLVRHPLSSKTSATVRAPELMLLTLDARDQHRAPGRCRGAEHPAIEAAQDRLHGRAAIVFVRNADLVHLPQASDLAHQRRNYSDVDPHQRHAGRNRVLQNLASRAASRRSSASRHRCATAWSSLGAPIKLSTAVGIESSCSSAVCR